MTSRAIAMLCMGDSVTRGAIGTNPSGGFRGLIWAAIQGDYTVHMVGSQTEGFGVWDHHEGYGGYGIGGAGGGPAPQLMDIVPNLTTSLPDLVLLLAGANEMVQAWSTPTTRGTALTRLGDLLDAIRAASPRVHVAVCTLPPIDFTIWTTSGATNSDRTAYNSGITTVVSARSAWATKIDLASVYTTSDTVDGLHPNGNGNALLAAAMVTGLQTAGGALATLTGTQLVDGNTLLNSACGEGAADMRTSGGGQHLWFLREVGSRINRAVPLITSVDDSAPYAAKVERGNWVVRCQTCQTTSAVWINRQLLFCPNCWNSGVGNLWRTITLPDAATRLQIEALLTARPVDNQWWAPGESVSALAAENTAHGW